MRSVFLNRKQPAPGAPQSLSALGLGTMSIGGSYGDGDERESLATLELALDLGINFFDTADFYGVGRAEELLGRFLKGHRREQVFLSVKVGPMVTPTGGIARMYGHPDYLRSVLAYDLRRLGVEYIDLYFPSRMDRSVPLADQMGALVEMKEQGFIRHIGLSEVSAETVRRAHAIHPIAAVQTEYSLWSREPEEALLPALRELGIVMVGYAPLSRGFLSGQVPPLHRLGGRDVRRRMPRYQDEHFEANQALVDRLRDVAAKMRISPAQLAIAWVLHQGDDIISLFGTKQRKRLQENLGALEVRLSEEVLNAVAAAVPKGSAHGQRYSPAIMHTVDG